MTNCGNRSASLMRAFLCWLETGVHTGRRPSAPRTELPRVLFRARDPARRSRGGPVLGGLGRRPRAGGPTSGVVGRRPVRPAGGRDVVAGVPAAATGG